MKRMPPSDFSGRGGRCGVHSLPSLNSGLPSVRSRVSEETVAETPLTPSGAKSPSSCAASGPSSGPFSPSFLASAGSTSVTSPWAYVACGCSAKPAGGASGKRSRSRLIAGFRRSARYVSRGFSSGLVALPVDSFGFLGGFGIGRIWVESRPEGRREPGPWCPRRRLARSSADAVEGGALDGPTVPSRSRRLRQEPAASGLARRRPRRGAVRHQLRGGRREQHPPWRRRLGGVPVRDRRRPGLARPAPHEHGVDLRVRLPRRLLAPVADVRRR